MFGNYSMLVTELIYSAVSFNILTKRDLKVNYRNVGVTTLLNGITSAFSTSSRQVSCRFAPFSDVVVVPVT